LTFPGASVPNAMVQLSPITKFGSGAGYEYENPVIHAFAHSNKGHWNLCNIPILPVAGEIDADNFGSKFSHTNESAHPGYYQVFLDRYKINAELTTTLRCGYHKYTYQDGTNKRFSAKGGGRGNFGEPHGWTRRRALRHAADPPKKNGPARDLRCGHPAHPSSQAQQRGC